MIAAPNSDRPNPLLAAALGYARGGWLVLPLHSIRNGRCTCGKTDCGSPGKHPRVVRGLKDATTDAAQVSEWWRRWPDANIGIRTGAESGIVVLDIDPRHGGEASLAALLAEFGELPVTVESATGGSGRHLPFAHPGGTVRNASGRLGTRTAAGIDVRGDGGYIVAPPSNHVSGGVYTWRAGYAFGDLAPAPMPGWLVELLQAHQAPSATPDVPDDTALLIEHAERYAAKVPSASEGVRNTKAFSVAGHLAAFRTEGGVCLSDADVFRLVEGWNARNTPPLPVDELRSVVHSALTNGSPRAAHIVRPRPIEESAAVASKVVLAWRPFPTDALPRPMADFVREYARALGCDESQLALPLLAVTSSAVGNSCVLRIKRSWREPAILWVAVVKRSGEVKSPALEAVLRPVRHREDAAFREYEEKLALHALDVSRWEAQPKKERGGSPTPPLCVRYAVEDITVEALAVRLRENPRGLIVVHDELAGLFGGFNAYRAKGVGADDAKWRAIHGARTLTVDRKTGAPVIRVPRPNVSICGCIPPGELAACLVPRYFSNGMAARWLFAMPPSRPRRWTDAEPSPAVDVAVSKMLDRLYRLPLIVDVNHCPKPDEIKLAADARAAFIAFVNQHNAEAYTLDEQAGAAFSKLEAYCGRLALVLHLATWAAGGAESALGALPAEIMDAAVRLTRWFAHETRRVYARLAETDEERTGRQLIELIRRKGGAITARDIMRSSRMFDSTIEAESALAELVKQGFGHWDNTHPGEDGGRPSRRFVLDEAADQAPTDVDTTSGAVPVDDVDVDNTPTGGPASEGFVNGSSVNSLNPEGFVNVNTEPECDSRQKAGMPADDAGQANDGEWGEI